MRLRSVRTVEVAAEVERGGLKKVLGVRAEEVLQLGPLTAHEG